MQNQKKEFTKLKSLVNTILIFSWHQVEQNQTMYVARAATDLPKAFSTDLCQTLDWLQPTVHRRTETID